MTKKKKEKIRTYNDVLKDFIKFIEFFNLKDEVFDDYTTVSTSKCFGNKEIKYTLHLNDGDIIKIVHEKINGYTLRQDSY